MHTLTRTLVLLAACGAVAPAFAQQGSAAERLAARFKAADANHDGKLTLDEAKAGMPVVARNFDKIDSTHAGSITLEQIAAWAMQQKRG